MLDEEAQTIQLTATPDAPLTCLKVTVNGEALQMNSTGSINMTEYFFHCHDQIIQLKVNTDANGTQQDHHACQGCFQPRHNSGQINTIGPINLAYDGHSKIVRVEANEGTLACAGDMLKVTAVDNSG